MNKYSLCTLFVLFINYKSFSSTYPSEIIITLKVLNNNPNNTKSSSEGEKMLELNGYSLFEVISNVTDIPVEYFFLEGNSYNPIVNFRVISTVKLERKDMIIALNSKLKEELDISFSYAKVKRQVEVMFCLNKDKFLENKCPDSENTSTTRIVNRTLKAKCITIDDLIERVHDWFNLKIVSDLDSISKYNFEVHHANTFEEFKNELEFYYSLGFKTESRNVEGLSLIFKN
jgi:hypothetical protein